MEVHMMFFKSSYISEDRAINEPDGICFIAYFVKVTELSETVTAVGTEEVAHIILIVQLDKENEDLAPVVNLLEEVENPVTCEHLEPMALSFVPLFKDDYLLYWGHADTTPNSSHTILWIISRIPILMSAKQVCRRITKSCG